MASNRYARQQITAFLAANGPIDDSSGRATAKLKTAVSYQSSPAAFSQLLSAMERSGEIERVTKGKRTFRIAIGAAGDASGSRVVDSGASTDVDYEQLAESLLLKAVEAISAGNRPAPEGDAWARRRIERLERRNSELEQSVSRSKAEARAIAEERDVLKQQLEHTAGNLALLTDRLESRPNRERISKELGDDERELLSQLRRSTAGSRGGPTAAMRP